MCVLSNKDFKLCITHIVADSPAHVRLERLCDARVEGADDVQETKKHLERADVAQLLVMCKKIVLFVVDQQLLACPDVVMEDNAFVYMNLAVLR